MQEKDDLVHISEAVVAFYLSAYPRLTRIEVMGSIVRVGPYRAAVERDLAQLHHAKAESNAHAQAESVPAYGS